jgi:hypothetical protein
MSAPTNSDTVNAMENRCISFSSLLRVRVVVDLSSATWFARTAEKADAPAESRANRELNEVANTEHAGPPLPNPAGVRRAKLSTNGCPAAVASYEPLAHQFGTGSSKWEARHTPYVVQGHHVREL